MALETEGLNFSVKRCLWDQLFLNLTVKESTLIDHKVSEEIHQKVREHIMSFPARQSHYSRRNNPGRLYLSPDLSIVRLYQMFLAMHDPEYVEYIERREALITHQETEIIYRKKAYCFRALLS